MWPGPSKSGLCRQNLRICGRLKPVTARLSSSDIAQQPASAASGRWLLVERYLKNLIEKWPASVCHKFSNSSFGDIGLISMQQLTIVYKAERIKCALLNEPCITKWDISRKSCNSTILGRLQRVTSRLSSSDIAQQPASAPPRAGWLLSDIRKT